MNTNEERAAGIEDIDWEELQSKAAARAKAKAMAEFAEDYRKTVKAKLMFEAEKQGVTAANAQEKYAYAHPDYLKNIEEKRKAREEFELLDMEYKLLFERIGVWRSRVALYREVSRVR